VKRVFVRLLCCCRYQEKFYFNPGDTGFKVWDTTFGRIGAAICWDQWFPETARCLALLGAEVRLVEGWRSGVVSGSNTICLVDVLSSMHKSAPLGPKQAPLGADRCGVLAAMCSC
jgi:hypothetical protein